MQCELAKKALFLLEEWAINRLGIYQFYANVDHITDEIRNARRLFSEQGWPVIDVTRRSVEETAAAIIQLYTNWQELQS